MQGSQGRATGEAYLIGGISPAQPEVDPPLVSATECTDHSQCRLHNLRGLTDQVLQVQPDREEAVFHVGVRAHHHRTRLPRV